MSITITGEKAPKPCIRDPPSGTFCLVRSNMERLLLSRGKKGWLNGQRFAIVRVHIFEENGNEYF